MRGASVHAIIALLMATARSCSSFIRAPRQRTIEGAQLAAMCASCHRLDGRDKGIPSIIGLDKEQARRHDGGFQVGQAHRARSCTWSRVRSATEEIARWQQYLAARQKGAEQP